MISSDAVVLISGGLDSTTVLAWAKQQAYERLYSVSFDYGQRHRVELDRAKRIAESYGVVQHLQIQIPSQIFTSSSLVNRSLPVESADRVQVSDIPSSYVPVRNLLFLSYAGALAESLLEERSSVDVLLGINAVDYGNYPDCRPAFLESFEKTLQLASKNVTLSKGRLRVLAPLLHLSKVEIIQMGLALGVEFRDTLSCYQPDDDGRACGHCLSCHLRQQGFINAGVEDPTIYQNKN